MRSGLLSCIFLLAAAAPVQVIGHHSHGNYVMTEWTYLAGTVTELHWVNPHAWVYIEVADENGETAIWALEAASVTTLAQKGLSQDTIGPGDIVSVRCHRLRDGANGCLLGYLTPEGGEEVMWD
jgi:hypothetical protein